MRHIFKCCSCNVFTMKEFCPKCNEAINTTKPARFSPVDKWGFYRRRAKREKGLI